MALTTNLKATLKSVDSIEVAVYKSYTSSTINFFNLYENNVFVKSLKAISKSESKSSFIYTLAIDYNFQVGKLYEITDDRLERTPLDTNVLAKSKDFEKNYRYDGELGALYTKEKTTFRLFSPLASSAFVHLINANSEELFIPMKRLNEGVYEATIEGDYEKARYTYIVKLNGEFKEAPDPYSFSLGSNSQFSYIVDLTKIKNYRSELKNNVPELHRLTDAILYELDVRDMTSLTELTNKGTYKALCTSGLTNFDRYPIGLDYIKGLGITHIQILPVYDFQTHDDDHPFSSYNWGYDPLFYFAPEGSYSSNPNDPYARLLELKELVSTYHNNGIGVIMDVVFNHVFNASSNALQVLCPDYYFRFNSDGSLSNGSGCGNDFETRNYMARKLIIDALKFFTLVYGIDGYRFDLMGIIDVDTMNLAFKELQSMKKDVIFYGEGWDMCTNLPGDKKASMYNANSIKPIGFFNDRFRDIVKGRSSESELANRGYLTGDTNYIDGFKNVFLGSSVTLAFPPLFSNPNQSINYVECHDNNTLFDKLQVCLKGQSNEDILRHLKLINAITIFSFGVPFIHAGQEYGMTKKMIGNSYNSGDDINGFDYVIAKKRIDCINYLKDAIKLKKQLPFLSSDSKKEMTDHVTFENISNGCLLIRYRNNEDDYYLFINPTGNTISYQFDNYAKVIFNEAGLLDDNHFSQLIMINKYSLAVAKVTR